MDYEYMIPFARLSLSDIFCIPYACLVCLLLLQLLTHLAVVQSVKDFPLSNSEQPNMLVLSNDAELLDSLVSRATSFSISLGMFKQGG